MDAFWLVINGIQANFFLIGLYAVVDYVLPMVAGPVVSVLPGEARTAISMMFNGAGFITKQICFHYFSASQIKALLG
jgi:hypothetical protein